MNRLELICYARQRVSRSRSVLRLVESNLFDDIYRRKDININKQIITLVKALDANGLRKLIRLQMPREQSHGFTHKQLLIMAKELKIPNYSTMRKEDLIFTIHEWKRANGISQIPAS